MVYDNTPVIFTPWGYDNIPCFLRHGAATTVVGQLLPPGEGLRRGQVGIFSQGIESTRDPKKTKSTFFSPEV